MQLRLFSSHSNSPAFGFRRFLLFCDANEVSELRDARNRNSSSEPEADEAESEILITRGGDDRYTVLSGTGLIADHTSPVPDMTDDVLALVRDLALTAEDGGGAGSFAGTLTGILLAVGRV